LSTETSRVAKLLVPATFSDVGEILEIDILVRFAVPDTFSVTADTFVVVRAFETNKFTMDAVLFTVSTFWNV
jgi:hypothetical protein